MSAEHYMILGLAIFIGLHIVSGHHEWRQAALNTIGILTYRLLISIGSLYALWVIIVGFSLRPFDVWWYVPDWATFAPIIIMPLTIILTICHFLPKESDTFTRQPAGWAIIFWAVSHLFANGESGTTIFFAGFLIYGILAIFLRERKASLGDETARHGTHDTPLIPFTYIPQGLFGKKLAFILATTVVILISIVYVHEQIIGLSAFPVEFR